MIEKFEGVKIYGIKKSIGRDKGSYGKGKSR